MIGKKKSQKLSKWGVVKLVGSVKLESGVDKREVREREKKKTHETWTCSCDLFNFWIWVN